MILPESIIICWMPSSLSYNIYLLAFVCKEELYLLPAYFSVHLGFYQYGLRYFYSIQWVIIHYCVYYHAHIDPIAFILKMTSLWCWAEMGWSHVYLVPHCPRKESSNTFFSFSWQSSIHLLWLGRFHTLQTHLPLSSRMEGAAVLPAKALLGLRQTQVGT